MFDRKKRNISFVIIFIFGTLGALIFLLGWESTSDKSTGKEFAPKWSPMSIDDIYHDFETTKINLDDYIWPTNITNILTSTFGEFRTTHFHSGIDISTRGRIGAPVFASRSGYIEQVSVSPFGYGKHIVMRHPDGYATLYAHLDRFDEVIENEVYKEQLIRENYSVRLIFPPEKFVFQQGDIIAYSGSTGSGPPHLHFEIRDPNNNPIQPKLSSRISINDNVPPTFNRIAVLPIDENAFINNSISPRVYNAVQEQSGKFRINNPIRITGTIGFAVDIVDRNSDTWYRHGIYGLEFYFNDSLLYRLRYDQLRDGHGRQIRLHYDQNLFESRRGRFQKLFIEDGNIIPLYFRKPWGSGLINASYYNPGNYQYKIVAYDFAGNKSQLIGELEIEEPKEPIITQPLDLGNLPAIQASAPDIKIKPELYRNILITSIAITNRKVNNTALFLKNGGSEYTVPLIKQSINSYVGRYAIHSSSDPEWEIYFVLNDTIYKYSQTLYSITPYAQGEIISDDGNLKISFNPGSVYHPIHFMIEPEELDYGRKYRFSPYGYALDEGIFIEVNIPEYINDQKRTVLYNYNNGRNNTLRSRRNLETRTISARIQNLPDAIVVSSDTTAPTIENVIVEGNRNLRLRFRIFDNESGIDHSSLRITLDDRILIGRYDPDHAMVIHQARKPLEPGNYTLKISVADRVGNGTRYERNVVIR